MSPSRKIFQAVAFVGSLAGVLEFALSSKVAQTSKSEIKQPDTSWSCIYDVERGEFPGCLHQSANGDWFVAQEVLKELHFDAYGLASVFSPRYGWMYVGRKGIVIVRGVPTMDNGPDSFHDGLVRVVTKQKYGFANRKGQLVIPPAYDGAMNFEKGKARVCKGCKEECAGTDCEHHWFSGGQWFQIDTKGKIVARIQPQN